MLTPGLMFALALCGESVAQPPPGLLFHATFDDTLEAFSLAGRGSPLGAEAVTPEYAPGRLGNALVGGPGRALPTYTATGNVLPACGTVSLWVYSENWTPDDPNFHVLFEAGAGVGRAGWLILYKYYDYGWLLLRYADEAGKVGMCTGKPDTYRLAPGEWHHLAGTWSEGALRLYVDGDLIATAASPPTPRALGETFALGDNGWHLPHDGARTRIDDVRLYAYPLSHAEIRALAGRGQLVVSRAPGGDAWRLRYTAPGAPDGARVRFEVRSGSEARPLQSAEGVTAQGTAEAVVPIGELPAGEYTVSARGDEAAPIGTPVAEATMRKLDPETLSLGNEQLRLTLDAATGGVLAIEAPALGFACREDRPPAPLWALESVSFAEYARFYPPSAVQERTPTADSLVSATVERQGDEQLATLTYALAPDVGARVTVRLADASPAATFRLRLENRKPLRASEAVRLPRVTFPRLSALRIGADPTVNRLATGYIQGEVLQDPSGSLPDERTLQYPGSTCVPWQDLYGPAGGLWLGPLSDAATQLEIVAGAEEGAVSLGNRWWCLLEPGESWESPEVELGVHPGAWHWGAERFREWSLAHTPPRPQPEWLGDCDGWTGSGSPNYRFSELPEMLRTAKHYGFSYLQLWSQMILGGAYYCYFHPNPDLGTEEELRAAIRQVHAEGGHVGFYSNVITFDASIDRNQALTRTIAQYDLKDLPPRPGFFEEVSPNVFVGPGGAYGKGGASGHSESAYPDGYWAMDPNSPWWQDYLAGWIDRWHRDYGADVWYLDSFPIHGYGLGPASYSLHLPRPRSLSAGQLDLLRRIRRDFDGPLLYEGVACAALMPYTNWCLGTEFSFGSGTWSCPEIFAFSFSDVYPVFSGTCNTWEGIKRIQPDLAPGRREDTMNHVFLLGERFDTLGLHPLRPEDPYGQHVKALVALRAKVRDVLYQGRMADRLGLSGMPERVEARVFVRQTPPGAVVTIVDRRPERTAWELTLRTSDLPWPGGLIGARTLRLDGTEVETPLTTRDGVLSLAVEAAEVQAVRFGGN